MEKATLTFLGTASAVPTKKRNHTAMLLSYKNENILIDCGEGTQRQFRIAEISPSKITKILITHWHGDHVLGIPGLLQTLAMNEYAKELQIFGPKGSKNYFELLTKIFRFKLQIKVFEISSGAFYENDEFCLAAQEMKHDTPTLAYLFQIKEKLRLDPEKIKKLKLPNSPILKELQQGKDITFNGKKIKASQVSYEEKGRKLTIILDTLFNKEAISFAKDSDILVAESSFAGDEVEIAKEYMHLTASQAAEIAQKSKSKKLILTHLSQRHEPNPQPVLQEAQKVFKNTSLAKDFDVVEF